MTQAELRIRVFASWITFWILSTVAIVLGPIVRGDQAIGDEQVMPAIVTTMSIWLPPLTCFAAFWFPSAQRSTSRKIRLTRDRVVGAQVLTFVYLAVVLLLVLRPVYIVTYDSTGPELAPGTSFEEQLAAAAQYAALLSPLALAPTIWLTGVLPTGRTAEPGS